MVWEVLGSHKIKWEAMRFVLGEWKEFKQFLKLSFRNFQVKGGRNPLRRVHHLGMRRGKGGNQ